MRRLIEGLALDGDGRTSDDEETRASVDELDERSALVRRNVHQIAEVVAVDVDEAAFAEDDGFGRRVARSADEHAVDVELAGEESQHVAIRFVQGEFSQLTKNIGEFEEGRRELARETEAAEFVRVERIESFSAKTRRSESETVLAELAADVEHCRVERVNAFRGTKGNVDHFLGRVQDLKEEFLW